MTQPATTNNAIIATQDLTQSLIDDFIAYINRSEKTTRTYLTNLRQFIAWLKYAGINHPTRNDIISYMNYLSSEHDAIKLDPASPQGWTYRTDHNGNPVKVTCRPNTVKLYLQSVSQFFSWAAVNGHYENIATGIHPPKVRHDAHKKEAFKAFEVLAIEQSIAAHAEARQAAAAAHSKDTAGRICRATEQDKRLFAMYLLATNAGLRCIELSRAKLSDIAVRNGQAFIYIWGKGHTEPDQKKPLAPQVYEAIRDYIDSRTDNPTANSPLFVATGNRSGGKGLASTTISTMLKKAMQQAGFDDPRYSAHSLRHSCGTNTQELTNNLYLTQKYMRHENPATTEIYLHIETEKQEADIAQALYNKYHGIAETTQPDTGQLLAALLQNMTAAQIKQIMNAAAAI